MYLYIKFSIRGIHIQRGNSVDAVSKFQAGKQSEFDSRQRQVFVSSSSVDTASGAHPAS